MASFPYRPLGNIVAGLAVLGLSLGPIQAQQGGPQAYGAYMDAAVDLGASIDRSQFDLDALALELALSDPDEIAARVDALIATQIYPGALRGAAGTLRAGAGNSLDQTLLLARLLSDAGQEIRIARTRLSEAQTAQLRAASGAPSRPPALRDAALAEDALARMVAAIEEPALIDALRDYLTAPAAAPVTPPPVTAAADALVAALGAEMPAPGPLEALLTDEARDYFWIQHRLFGGDPWADLHVAFHPDAALQAESFVASPLPDELQHRVSVDLSLRLRVNGRIENRALMSQVRFATAATGPAPLVFTIIPDGAIKGEPDVFKAVADSNFYFPLFNGALAERALAFTADGLTIPAEDVLAGGATADLIATVGARAGEALDVLSQLGGREEGDLPPNTPMTEVLGIVMTVTHAPPYGAGRVIFERHVVDRVGADGRAEGMLLAAADAEPVATAVLGRWTLITRTGGAGPAEVVAAQIDRALSLRDGMEAAAAGGNFLGFPPVNPVQALIAGMLFDQAAEQGVGAGRISYRAGPSLMLVHHGARHEGSDLRQVAGLDILSTARRAIGPDGVGDPLAALRAGVAETLFESNLGSAIAPGTIGAPLPDSGSWSVLSAAPALQVAASRNALPDLAPGSRAAAEADIARGNLLALAQGGDAVAWWRVDPLTGASIGVDAIGRGGEAAEYLSLVDAIVSGLFIGYGASTCGGSGAAYACCVGANFAFGMLGFAVLAKLAQGAEVLMLADAYGAGAVGFGTGVGISASGWNPLSGLCPS